MSEIPDKNYLRNYSLSKILTSLNRRRKTGVLSVSSQGVAKRIFLRKGNAIFASSDYEDDRLGEMLVKAGKITMLQYEASVGVMKTTKKRLGSVLVELGYLTPKELFTNVKNQVREIIFSLFNLKDGMYEFVEEEIPSEVITLDLSMANIIYEGVGRVDDWTRIRNEMPDPDTVFIFSSDPMSLFQNIKLSENDRKMLSLLDGLSTMKEVIEDSGLNNFEASKTLYVLWSIGMITEQVEDKPVSLSVDDILNPVDEEKDEFLARVTSTHAVLDSISHHKLLEVEEGTSFELVNSQYYKLAKEFHPDRFGDSLDSATKDMVRDIFDGISRAYESLKQGLRPPQSFNQDVASAADLLIKGKGELKNRNFRRAAELLTEAVNKDPVCADCWNYYSLSLARLKGRTDEAEKAIGKAVELDPDNADFQANLGLVFLATKRHDPARAQFEKALSLDPMNKKAQKGLEKVWGSGNGFSI